MDAQTTIGHSSPELFQAQPGFSDAVNGNIIRSEVEGGVYLRNLLPGAVLSIKTQNRVYTMEVLADGTALLSGHPEFCPEPTKVHIQGSTWGGSMLKMKYIGRSMQMEFMHPSLGRIVTSRIADIRAY